MSIKINLLNVTKGLIVAPAGCGKTQLIVDSLKTHSGKKPALVLTHTNAGVAALKIRLEKNKIAPSSYRLVTIDGWVLRLISAFPNRSEHNPEILKLSNPGTDYKNIRIAAATLFKNNHINDILVASYSNLLVDEYQDCSVEQHEIISYVSNIIPTCILGDELQAIFGFRGNKLVDWNQDVCTNFPIIQTLDTPWRWTNAGSEELGKWLLAIRSQIIRGEEINLKTAPKGVQWVCLDGKSDHERQLAASYVKTIKEGEKVLIIGCSKNPESRHKIASNVVGAVTVEPIDLGHLVSFAHNFDLMSKSATKDLIDFSKDLMTNIGAQELIKRIESISNGTARNPPNEVENSAIIFKKNPSYKNAVDLLVKINKQAGVRIYRPTIFKIFIKALNACSDSSNLPLKDVVMKLREQNRFVGRKLPSKAVGSTLLLKGLESEAVVILNADDLNAQNLYVAMTRGSKFLTVCSKSYLLKPIL